MIHKRQGWVRRLRASPAHGGKGKSSIRGGRANLRQTLYMPALVAIRLNEEITDKYKAMTEVGKPAVNAIMQKLS